MANAASNAQLTLSHPGRSDRQPVTAYPANNAIRAAETMR